MASETDHDGEESQQHPLHRHPPRRRPFAGNLDPRDAEEPGEGLAFQTAEATVPTRNRWKGAVKQIIKEQRGVSLLSDAGSSQHSGRSASNRHRRLGSTGVHDVLQAMQEIGQQQQQQQTQQDEAVPPPSWTDTIFNADQDMQSDLNLINHGVLQQVAEEAEEEKLQEDEENRHRLSFLSRTSDEFPNGTGDGGPFQFGTSRRAGRKGELIPLFATEDTSNSDPRLGDTIAAEETSQYRKCFSVFWYASYWFFYSCCCGRSARLLRKIMFHALYQIRWVLVTIPMTILTTVLYYHLGNPSPDFLPGAMTLSWLGNFLSRHIVLWNLAQLTQFCIIDIFLMASHKLVVTVGPVVTLLLLQAKGWPFVFIIWGILALFLLHGDNDFQTHWLYWTDIDVFSKTNSGSYILSSTIYTNILIGMIVSGSSTAVKRFLLTVYFGRRQFNFFKPRLEKLLSDVVLVSEIATLAQAEVGGTDLLEQTAVDWKTMKRSLKDTSNDNDYDEDYIIMSDDSQASCDEGTKRFQRMSSQREEQQSLHDSTRSFGQFKNRLDEWEEPAKEGSHGDFRANIADVLQFKRALTFMDDTYPFGEHFGPSSNRNECIRSSQDLYKRLYMNVLNSDVNNTNPETQVPFSVFESLYVAADGTVDRKVRAKLKRIFPPTSLGTVDPFTFVQSVDSLYRRLRYFSASVRNDAGLDKVLENMINTFYYLLLGLFLVSLLNYNPWSMLVSITSLLVSLSFAFGQTVSRYVEGILTVAVGRPFDLGDRIYLVNATDAHEVGDVVGASLFVEDINLSKTRLRYASTGEILYMSNYLLSTMRIYNLNRSPNAIITFSYGFGIRLLESDNLEKMRTSLIQFVADHPVRWESFIHLRVKKVSAGDENVQCECQLRHRSTWQNAASIKNDESDLMEFLYDRAMSMGVSYEVSPARSIIYQGGGLQQGVAESRLRLDLLQPQNIYSLKGNKEF